MCQKKCNAYAGGCNIGVEMYSCLFEAKVGF